MTKTTATATTTTTATIAVAAGTDRTTVEIATLTAPTAIATTEAQNCLNNKRSCNNSIR